jgi:hypothetical protein
VAEEQRTAALALRVHRIVAAPGSRSRCSIAASQAFHLVQALVDNWAVSGSADEPLGGPLVLLHGRAKNGS